MNVIGFDDGPFERDHRGNVLLVGVVCSDTRVDGIVSGHIRRDGADATRRMVELVRQSQFAHVQAIMLQGIAVGGFNVVDVQGLSKALSVPVIVVARRLPDMSAVRRALLSEDPPGGRTRVAGALRKWKLIEAAGELEPIGPSKRALKRDGDGRSARPTLWIQRVGLSLEEARRIVLATTLHGSIPEPLRVAHLVAGGITTGRSRGRA